MPKQPVGPPPAYPGLSNRPVNSQINPPAYSPSYSNPPAYSGNRFNQPSYPSASPAYSGNRFNQPSYSPGYSGSQIGRTYSNPSYSSYPNSYNPQYSHSYYPHGSPSVMNNHYYNSRSSGMFGGSSLLSGAGGFGLGYMAAGGFSNRYNGYNSYNSYNRPWGYEEERNWRRTTKPSYFNNHVPGNTMPLPAAAVLGLFLFQILIFFY